MKRFTSIIALLAFCTQLSDGVSPSIVDGVKQNYDSVTFVQKSKKIRFATQRESLAQKAYIDPETSQFVSQPEQDVPIDGNPIETSTLSSSTEKIEEKSSPVPGGGMMIDLKGRFQNPIIAAIKCNKQNKN